MFKISAPNKRAISLHHRGHDRVASRISVLGEAKKGGIEFDITCNGVFAGGLHRLTDFMFKRPRGLITSQSEFALELKRGNSFLRDGDPVTGPKDFP